MSVFRWGDTQLVNTNTTGNQRDPDVAVLADGDFVVVWSDQTGFGNVRAQGIDAKGVKVGGEISLPISIGIDAGDAIFNPSITARQDGGFTIMAVVQDAPGDQDIAIWHFDENGVLLGGTAEADNGLAVTTGDIDLVGDGTALETNFVYQNNDLNGGQIELKRTDSSGAVINSTLVVNANDNAGAQYDISVARSETGTVLVTWFDDQTDRVYHQLTDGNGATVNSRGFIVANGLNAETDPKVAALANGAFAIVYNEVSNDFPDPDGGVRFAIVEGGSNGVPVSGQVGARIGNQEAVAVTALTDGFVIIYHEAKSLQIRGQKFDMVGNAIGGEFHVTDQIFIDVNEISVDAMPDGRFVVTWESDSSTLVDSGFGIYAQIMDPRDGIVVGTFTSDTLYGSFQNDQIIGYSGDDKLFGGGDNDVLSGGGNNDTVRGEAGDDVLYGGQGNDVLIGDSSSGASVMPLAGNDTLFGEEGVDQLYGEDGNDWLDGGNGLDTVLDGGAGIDTISFMTATNGATLYLFQADNQVQNDGYGNIETLNSIEWAVGSRFGDALLGDFQNNVLNGLEGDDVFYASFGNDFIVGGEGNDFMQGDEGFDAFAFDLDHFESGVYDTIADFSESSTSFDNLYFTGLTLNDLTIVDFGGDVFVYTTGALDTGVVVQNFSAAQLADQMIFA